MDGGRERERRRGVCRGGVDIVYWKGDRKKFTHVEKKDYTIMANSIKTFSTWLLLISVYF
jgi:hypothetical protein